MKRFFTLAFPIFFFFLLFSSNVALAAPATSCYACLDKVGYGQGLLHDNQDNYDPRNFPVSKYPKICIYGDSSGQSVYFPPDPNGSTCTTDKPECNAHLGCVASGTQECANNGHICQGPEECGNQQGTCANTYCMSGPYRVQPGQQGTCQTMSSDPGLPPGVEQTCNSKAANTGCPAGKVCSYDGKCVDPYNAGQNNLACVPDIKFDGSKIKSVNFVCKTAVGNIDTNPDSFIQNVLRLVLGLAGGILLIMIIINGYKFMTSQGDPEKIKDAREGIIAAISGILLIILSLIILQVITVDVLGLPGFSAK